MKDTTISRRFELKPIPGYQLVQVLGHGGMGDVHQALQLSLNRMVAIKCLKPELAQDPQFVGRFEKEAAALASLRHPHIVSVLDKGKNEDTFYLVMELVDGPSLRERMREPDFDTATALETMLLVARAIAYAHGRGVVHRDLKPENVLFDEQAGLVPKVTDFGLAGLDESFGPLQRNLTQTHVSMGTAAYMAPEQAIDAKSAGPRADVYSLGVMLYEVLTGVLPVGTFDAPSLRTPGVDRRVDPIVDRCLKPNPDDRYPTVAALVRELEAVTSRAVSTIAMAKAPRSTRLFRAARQTSGVLLASVTAVVLVASSAVVLSAFARARTQAREPSPGTRLMTDFGVRLLLGLPGRIDRGARGVSFGAGPDRVGLVALGRAPTLDGSSIVYGPATEEPVGRTLVDVELEARGLELSALVDTEPPRASPLEPLWALFRGPRRPPRSALILEGTLGRSVALVVSSGDGEPRLEWALGPERRGVMTAPLVLTPTRQRLALRIDPVSGELLAVVGEGRDARVLGDGVALGSDWKDSFGEAVRAGVGCLDGSCAFHELKVVGLEAPKKPEPEPPPVTLGSPPPPPASPVVVTPKPLAPKKKQTRKPKR